MSRKWSSDTRLKYRYTWVKPRLINWKITRNSQKNESKLGHFVITKLNIITCYFKVILERFDWSITEYPLLYI